MNRIPRLTGFLLVFALVLAGFACTRSASAPKAMEPMTVQGELRNGFAVLVDVREEDEQRNGMAEPAVSMPTSKILAEGPEWRQFVAKLPKDKDIVFYCAAGGRAGKAAEKLAALGYRTANMGGYSDWVRAGLPVRKP